MAYPVVKLGAAFGYLSRWGQYRGTPSWGELRSVVTVGATEAILFSFSVVQKQYQWN